MLWRRLLGVVLVAFVWSGCTGGCRVLESLHEGEVHEGQFVDPRGFAYVPPEGWRLSDMEGNPLFSEPGHLLVEPNILFALENLPGGLEDRVRENLPDLETFQEFRNLGQEEFQTQSGVRTIRLETQATHEGVRYRQIYYFFDGREQVLGVCTRWERGQDHVDALCDETMKTFRKTVKTY